MTLKIVVDSDFRFEPGDVNARRLGWDKDAIFDRIQEILDREGVTNGYSIGSLDKEDCICFDYQSPFWTICYSERGSRFDPCFFCDFMEAAEYFVRRVRGKEIFPNLFDWRR